MVTKLGPLSQNMIFSSFLSETYSFQLASTALQQHTIEMLRNIKKCKVSAYPWFAEDVNIYSDNWVGVR